MLYLICDHSDFSVYRKLTFQQNFQRIDQGELLKREELNWSFFSDASIIYHDCN